MILPDEFKKWLSSEAAPGWIFGALAFFIAIIDKITSYLRRRRPNIVTCREQNKITLVRVNRRIIDNTDVLYKNKPVNNLSLVSFGLINTGDQTVKNLSVSITFDKQTKVLGVDVGSASNVNFKKSFLKNVIKLDLPYLNSHKDHGSEVTIDVICDGEIENPVLVGGGVGWSLKYVRKITQKERAVRLGVFTFVMLFEMVMSTYFTKPIEKDFVSNVFSVILIVTYVFGVGWVWQFRLKDFWFEVVVSVKRLLNRDLKN